MVRGGEVVSPEHTSRALHTAIRLMDVAVPAIARHVLAALPAEELGGEAPASPFQPISSRTLSNGVHRVELALPPVLISFRFGDRRARTLRDVPRVHRARFVEVRFVEESNETAVHPIQLILWKAPRRVVGWLAKVIIPQPKAIPRKGPALLIHDDFSGFVGRARRPPRPCFRSGFSVPLWARPTRAGSPHSFIDSL